MLCICTSRQQTAPNQTTHPPPSPPNKPFDSQLRAKGRLLSTSLSVMLISSTRSLAHPRPESSYSLPPPPIPHHHQPRTPLSSPTLLTFLSPACLSYRFTLASTPAAGDVTTTLHTHPLSNALLGGPLYRSVLAGRLPPSSVHPHARHRHVILRL